ncbi:hypothetical protein ACSNOI_36445, partial [Actinomadura kijaniata]|uniref:hypothetical protein n=1 Tax=Actinomadura kijaniata TaxID=46161 RepID=UPI003F1BEB91
RPEAPRPPGRDAPRERSRARRGPGPRLYFAAAGVLGVAVAGALTAVALTGGEERPKGPAAAARPGNAAAIGPSPVSYSHSPTNAAYAAIAERSRDPQPLTLEQMFPASATTVEAPAGARLKLRDKRVDTDCAAAVWGGSVARELARGGCNQAVRALFADTGRGYALSVTVLNLASSADADRTVETLGRVRGGGFVRPLPAAAPLDRFGRGFSMARGLAVGHYAVVAWAQRLDGRGDAGDETLLTLLIEGGKARGVLARAAHAG